MEYPTLLSPLFTMRSIPIDKSWRYKQRQKLRQYHNLEHINLHCRDQYIPSIQKDICLQDLMIFIKQRIIDRINQRYQMVMLTYSHNLPLDVIQYICIYTPPIL